MARFDETTLPLPESTLASDCEILLGVLDSKSRHTAKTECGDDSDSTVPIRTAGGIPYAVMPGYPIVRCGMLETVAEEEYRIRADHLEAFYLESMPLPCFRSQTTVQPPRRTFPGTSIPTERIEFTPLTDDLPADPLGVDQPITEDVERNGLWPYVFSYQPYMRARISYRTDPVDRGDGMDIKRATNTSSNNPLIQTSFNDYESFMELSMTTSGEFLYIHPTGVLTQGLNKAGSDLLAAGNAGGSGETVAKNYQDPIITKDGSGQPVADPDKALLKPEHYDEPEQMTETYQAMNKIIPIIRYQYIWHRVLRPNWDKILFGLGTVNYQSHPLFLKHRVGNSGTVLFTGFSARRHHIWAGGTNRAQPWELTFNFSQRIINEYVTGSAGDDQYNPGWNWVWVPRKKDTPGGRWEFAWLWLDPAGAPVFPGAINLYIQDPASRKRQNTLYAYSDFEDLFTQEPLGQEASFGLDQTSRLVCCKVTIPEVPQSEAA